MISRSPASDGGDRRQQQAMGTHVTDVVEHDGDVAADDDVSVAAEQPRAVTDSEKRLRQELVRARQQLRLVQGERDAILTSAHRERDLAVSQAREDARQRIVQAELKAHALRAGIVDLDGLRLADLGGVSLGEDGEILGAEETIATLRSDKPYLFAAAAQAPGVAEVAAPRRLHAAPAPATPRTVDARTLSREAWQAERAKLLSR
jgi:hypothetical protein